MTKYNVQLGHDGSKRGLLNGQEGSCTLHLPAAEAKIKMPCHVDQGRDAFGGWRHVLCMNREAAMFRSHWHICITFGLFILWPAGGFGTRSLPGCTFKLRAFCLNICVNALAVDV